MDIIIEKNVPLPTPTATAPRIKLTNTIKKMDTGDSFECPDTNGRRNFIYRVARLNGYKMQIRTVGADAIRVWRVQ